MEKEYHRMSVFEINVVREKYLAFYVTVDGKKEAASGKANWDTWRYWKEISRLLISKIARSRKFDQRHKRFLSLFNDMLHAYEQNWEKMVFFVLIQKNAKDKTGSE